MSWTRPRICPNRRVSRFSRTGRWGGGGGGCTIPGGRPLAKAFPSAGFSGCGTGKGGKGGEPILSVLGAQPCLAAGRPQPQPAAHSELRQGAAPPTARQGRGLEGAPGQGCGGREASAHSCTPSPGRAGEGRAHERTNRVAGSRLHACAVLPAFPPVVPAGSPARDAPRHSAPLALAQGLVM